MYRCQRMLPSKVSESVVTRSRNTNYRGIIRCIKTTTTTLDAEAEAGADKETLTKSAHLAKDSKTENAQSAKPDKKTQAELDEELRLKLEGISGEGGTAGLEYENGKAVAMKRSVKNNMFRLI